MVTTYNCGNWHVYDIDIVIDYDMDISMTLVLHGY